MKGMLKTQRRLASDLLGVGENKVWMDPSKFKEIKESITRGDVENLIEKGLIKKKEIIGQSRSRAVAAHLKRRRGHRKGPGSRKGMKNARMQASWKRKVRALRKALFKARESGKVDNKLFRVAYKKIKGNAFHSVAHMMNSIEEIKKA